MLYCLSVLSVCNVSVLWPNSWMDQDTTWYGGRPQPRPHHVKWAPSSPNRKGNSSPPLFGPCLLWPNSCPYQLLLSSCYISDTRRYSSNKALKENISKLHSAWLLKITIMSSLQCHKVKRQPLKLMSNLFVHCRHCLCDTLHGLRHCIVWLKCLNLQSHCLNVGTHQYELLYVASCSHQILCHDFYGILQNMHDFQ